MACARRAHARACGPPLPPERRTSLSAQAPQVQQRGGSKVASNRLLMRFYIPCLLAVLALIVTPSAVQADSGGAKISGLPESSSVEVFAEVSHTCYEGKPCDWFATAAAYSASSGCPAVFDATHGAWQSPIESYGVKRRARTARPRPGCPTSTHSYRSRRCRENSGLVRSRRSPGYQ